MRLYWRGLRWLATNEDMELHERVGLCIAAIVVPIGLIFTAVNNSEPAPSPPVIHLEKTTPPVVERPVQPLTPPVITNPVHFPAPADTYIDRYMEDEESQYWE